MTDRRLILRDLRSQKTPRGILPVNSNINYTKIIQIKSWIFFRKRSIVTIVDDYTEKAEQIKGQLMIYLNRLQ